MAFRLLLFSIALILSAGCMSPLTNTIRYATSDGEPYLLPAAGPATAVVRGAVTFNGEPLEGATVLVAEPQGTPHVTRSNSDGIYELRNLPPGTYIPIVVATGFEDEVLRNSFGLPWAVSVESDQLILVPEIPLRLLNVTSLLPEAAAHSELKLQDSYTATSPFPTGASAQVQHWAFQRNGIVNDTLFVYLPPQVGIGDTKFPLLFAIYPGHSLMWEDVSIAFASQGYAVVALSPLVAYGRDVIEHGEDARLALHFARNGNLGHAIDSKFPLAISGSYSSAVLNRLVRIERNVFEGVAMLGGISNAFTGAATFYAGDLDWPPEFGFALAALGTANAKPRNFMQFSPVYTAEVMPPTLLLHTQADETVPIGQSYEYEVALREAGVPVRTYYFADDSHYIQVGEETSQTTRRVFHQVIFFLQKQYTSAANRSSGMGQNVTLTKETETG